MQSRANRWLLIYLSEIEDPQSRDRKAPSKFGSTFHKLKVKSKIKHKEQREEKRGSVGLHGAVAHASCCDNVEACEGSPGVRGQGSGSYHYAEKVKSPPPG